MPVSGFFLSDRFKYQPNDDHTSAYVGDDRELQHVYHYISFRQNNRLPIRPILSGKLHDIALQFH